MITKKQFETVYRKHLPKKWELAYIKYVSIASLSQNVVPFIFSALGLIAPLFLSALACILKWNHIFITFGWGFYICVLAIIGVLYAHIWCKRQKRIKNICKDLNISKYQYEELVDRYYYHNYYPDIKDYINSILPENC